MQDNKPELLTQVSEYYAAKLALHGDNAKGVDWNGEDGQLLRFQQLSKIMTTHQAFSLCDLGCGYGAFYDYLKNSFSAFSYVGVDISKEMVLAAQKRHEINKDNIQFVCGEKPVSKSDYVVASGIFNVRLTASETEWHSYIINTLDAMHETSEVGFAFNCLTSYSDAHRMQDHLYYANPGALFDLCKRRYSLNVALLHDYGLYEFTMLVRKRLA